MKSQKKSVKVMFAIAMLLWIRTVILPRAAQAQPLAPCPTGAGGVISSDQTWSTSCSLSNDVTVNEGATLTINPGVVISFTYWDTYLFVNGSLNAQGTLANRIRFTSGYAIPGKGDWKSIVFNPSSTDNILEYVTIEYGGKAYDPNVVVKTDALTMNHVEIRYSDADGMRLIDASPSISNTSFNNNDTDALELSDSSFPQLSNLSASGNGFDGIALTSSNNVVTIASDYTWGAGLQNYRLASYLNVTVADGATLTIAPGTTIRMGNFDVDMHVNGSLQAQGTVANPILITSYADVPNKGDWRQIVFNAGSGNSLLEYVTVEYGGSASHAGIVIASSSVTIRYSTIARNGDEGIRVIAGKPTIQNNNIVENNGYGMINTQTDGSVTATCNWWGTDSGPTNSDNPDGTGQQVSSRIIFDPWLVAPAPDGACTGSNPHIYLPMVIR